MPTFLGSSFAFIAALQAVIGGDKANIPKAMGGIIVAGLFYVVLALLIRLFGSKFMDKLFPPVVRGVGIAIIGLNLASAAINNIQGNGITLFTPAYYWSWGIAIAVCLTAVILSSYGKGMVKMSSIVIALAAGYVLTLILTKTGLAPAALMDMGKIANHGWVEIPNFVLPQFDLKAIGMIAPIAIVTCVEHVGDVYANGSVVGKDFTKDPGLHRTMLGDGLATMAAGLFRRSGQHHLFGEHRRSRRHRQLQSCLPAAGGPHRHRDQLLRQGHRRGGNRAELRARRRLHRAVWHDLLRGPAHPGGESRGLHQKPQSLHRGGDAGAGHRRRRHRRPGL